MENEQPEFVDANAAPDPTRPINNNNRAMFNQDAQPARRTIGNFGEPTTFFVNRSAIRPPPVNMKDYEIKSSIINLVKQYQFHGSQRAPDGPHRLFRGDMQHHSIKRSTSRLPQMQAVCILVSRQGAPLAQIITTRLTYNVGRLQGSFPEPLLHQIKDERAKGQNHDVHPRRRGAFLRRVEPFQGIHPRVYASRILGVSTLVHLLRRSRLGREDDSRHNQQRNFLTRTEEDAKILLNNFASGSLDDKPSYARVNSQRTEYIERLTKQLEELSRRNRKMEVSLVRSQNPLYVCEAEQKSVAERSSANKGEARTPNKSRLEDILENKLESQRRIESRCDTLEEQVKQPASINALILRSGKALDEPYHQTQGEEPIVAEESPANTQSNDGDAENVDDDEASGGDHPIISTNPRSNTAEPVKHDTPNSYIPKVLYPDPRRKMKKKKEQEKCAEIVRGINVTMQLQDAIDAAPTFRKYMKDIITNKVTTGEGVVMITHECSVVLQN